MAILLDTNVLSELRKAGHADPAVRRWQAGVDPRSCWISVVSLSEIVTGIRRVETTDAGFAEKLRGWYEGPLKTRFSERTLPVDIDVAEKAGRIAAGRSRSLANCQLAATALVHRLELATRNLADFENLGLDLVNPWEG